MKIDTNTWHYKLWKFSKQLTGDYAEWKTTTLCNYFWRIIFSTLLFLPLYYMWRFIAFCSGFNSKIIEENDPEYDMLLSNTTVTKYTYKSKIRTTIFGALFISVYMYIALSDPKLGVPMFTVPVVVSFIFGSLFIIKWWVEKGSFKTESFRNVIKSYMRARKEKVCPIITFTKGEVKE